MSNIINGTRFDFSAINYLGPTMYPIEASDKITVEKIESIIPDNIFDLNREQLVPIVKAIMHEMNVAWSSTGGIPSFPEKFGVDTMLGIRPHSIHMSGRGWSFTLHRERYADYHPAFVKKISEIIRSETLTDDEKRDQMSALCGELATPIG